MEKEFEFNGTLNVEVDDEGRITLIKKHSQGNRTAIYPEELNKFKEIVELAIKNKKEHSK